VPFIYLNLQNNPSAKLGGEGRNTPYIYLIYSLKTGSAHIAAQRGDTVSMLNDEDAGEDTIEPTAPQDKLYPNIAAIRVSTWQLSKALERNNQHLDDN